MVRLTGIFSKLEPAKVLVIGDLMLDTYTIGKARRISPEAPVAVIHVQSEENRPGGAGNVILNLVSMGAEVIAVGRVGADHAGDLLRKSFEGEGLSTEGLFVQPNYPTPVKNRIIAENQQIVRIDHEKVLPIPEMLEQQVIESLPALLKDVKVVAISDYGKGFLSKTLLSALIEQAKSLDIPVIADPKGIDFSKYQGATILKPNLSEAYAAANLTPDIPLDQAAIRILQLSKAKTLMVTRSEAGISLFHQDGTRQDYPVRIREVKDVTGAGDTVLAMLSFAIANGLSVGESAQLSNLAAGIAIERFGCARVTLSDLAWRLLEFDAANKVFDVEHLFALQKALHGRKVAILGLNGHKGLSSAIFNTIRQLGHRHDVDLLVYVKDENPSEEFVNILAALHDVDFIILQGENLRSLCEKIHPEEVYVMEGDKLHKLDGASALVNNA